MTIEKTTADIDDYVFEGIGFHTDISIRYQAIRKSDRSPVMVEVASKKRFDTAQQIYEFHRRARTIASLKHGNLFLPNAFGVTQGNYPFLVWRPLEAFDLWDLLKGDCLSFQRKFIAGSFRDVCNGLGISASARVFHDALYPSDVLFLPSVVVISGFGRMLLDPEDAADTRTIFYKAPELWLGMPPDERSEVYEVGCLMYEALTAEPYELSQSFRRVVNQQEKGQCVQWLQRQKPAAVFSSGSSISNFRETISRCLQINPANRFEDLAQLKAELLIDWD